MGCKIEEFQQEQKKRMKAVQTQWTLNGKMEDFYHFVYLLLR